MRLAMSSKSEASSWISRTEERVEGWERAERSPLAKARVEARRRRSGAVMRKASQEQRRATPARSKPPRARMASQGM